jgi:gluconate 2-dehydrogenase gamma chain
MERRDFLKAAGCGAVLTATQPAMAAPRQKEAATAATHPPHQPRNKPAAEPRLFLTQPEAAFLAAVAEVMIPADANGPGGVEAGVVTFIDRQLAGAWGNGARMYLGGPWAEGTPQQGYQLPLTPARLFRAGMSDVDALARADGGRSFAQLPVERRDAILTALDKGGRDLATVPGKVFLETLRTSMVEGYFADPAYGGNRAMAGWRMVGFPGARGAYVDEIERWRGRPFSAEPVALADLQ